MRGDTHPRKRKVSLDIGRRTNLDICSAADQESGRTIWSGPRKSGETRCDGTLARATRVKVKPLSGRRL